MPTLRAAAKQLTPFQISIAIFSLAMGGFGIGTVEFAIMGLLPDVVRDLRITEPEGGHLISAYALGVVVGAPVLAALGAKWPRKHLVIGLMVMFTLGNLSSVVAPDYWTLMASRFLAGLPHGAYFGIAAVLASSLVAPTKRAWAVSMVMLGIPITNVIGVPFATWLGQHFGWRLIFVAVGAIGVLTLTFIHFFVPFQKAATDASIRRELSALKRPQLWLALLIGTIGFGGFFAVYTYIGFTVEHVTGLNSSALPWILAVYGLGMTAGNIIGGRLADKSVMGSIYACMGTIAAALLIFSLTASIMWAAVIMVFAVGAAGSSLGPGLQSRLMDVAPGAQNLAASLSHSALNIANALGAYLGGLVIALGWGYLAPALVGAVLAVLGLGVALLSGALDKRPAANPPSILPTVNVPSTVSGGR